MSVIDEAKAKIKGRGLKLVMPEGEDERIRAAAERFRREDLAEPVVFGAEDVPESGASHIAIIRRRREKMNDAMAARLLKKPLYRAGAAVAAGEVMSRRLKNDEAGGALDQKPLGSAISSSSARSSA